MGERIAVLVSGSGTNLQALLDHPVCGPRIALVLSDRPGVKAIERQDWKGAIRQFKTSVAWDRFNADAHNWLGFAYRNNGDLKRAFAEYEEALRLDPQHKGAHEYLGEAYVIAKNIPKAQEHLAALEKLCGQSCPEYKDLDEAIRKASGG